MELPQTLGTPSFTFEETEKTTPSWAFQYDDSKQFGLQALHRGTFLVRQARDQA